MRADACNHQQQDIKHGDGQRDAKHPPRPMRMRVCAMRLHVIRIAQGACVGTDALASLPWAKSKGPAGHSPGHCARLARLPRPVARTLPLALCFFPQKESTMKRIHVIPALLLLAAATAQTAPAQTKNPVSSTLRDILPGRQKNTIAAVEAMPVDKFNYRPSADQITFAHLVAHMVEANYVLCSNAASVPAPKVEGVKDTDTKDKLVAGLKASFDFCADALSKMDDSKLGEMVGGSGGQQ